jgi:two-component system response regulator
MNQSDLAAHFGASVRRLRFRLGISQEELAGRANLHRTYIAGIERGGRNITLKSAEKLARALQVSAVDLLKQPGKSREAVTLGEMVSALKEILLVEETSDDIEMTLQAFREAGIANPVHVAHDGAAALDYLFRAGAYAHRSAANPPLVLLNLQLPKVRGVDVLRRMKRHPATRQIPVIILTASDRSRDVAECHRLGVSTYIIKPFDIRNFSELTPQLRLQWALLETASLAAA